MKKMRFTRLPALLISCFLLLFTNPLHAQQEESVISVKVKIKEVNYNLDTKKVHPVWNFSTFDNKNLEIPLSNKGGDCYDWRFKKSHNTKEVDDDEQQLATFNASLPSFVLKMECFTSGKKGETCKFDTYAKDQDQAITFDTIKLDKLPPGQWSEPVVIEDNFAIHKFSSTLIYQYTIDKLPRIILSGTEEINNAKENIELKLPVALPVDNPWEYKIDEGGTWKPLESKDRDNTRIKFNPLKALFNGDLKATKKVLFRLNAYTGDGKKTSEQAEQVSLNFTPAPPSFDSSQELKSCPGLASGSLIIKKLRSVSDSIFYVLRKTVYPHQPCNPENTDTINCPGFIKKGGARNGGNIRITSLSPGDYTLQLYNADWNVGKVNTLRTFKIGQLPELKTKNFNYVSPTCSNDTSGEASVIVEGGADQFWQVVLTPSKGATLRKNGDQLYIKNLAADNYLLELVDQCGNTVPYRFTLDKAKKMSLLPITIIEITSDNKHENTMQLSLLNGRGPYKIILTDPEHLEKTFDDNTGLAIPFQNPGLYNMKIYDKANPECAPVNTNFTIVKTPKNKSIKFKIENQTF